MLKHRPNLEQALWIQVFGAMYKLLSLHLPSQCLTFRQTGCSRKFVLPLRALAMKISRDNTLLKFLDVLRGMLPVSTHCSNVAPSGALTFLNCEQLTMRRTGSWSGQKVILKHKFSSCFLCSKPQFQP